MYRRKSLGQSDHPVLPSSPPRGNAMGPRLRDLCLSEYFELNTRIRDEQTKRQYRFALDNFRDFLGREATIGDLSDDTLTRFMIWLRDVRQLHPRTCNDRRGRINALWRWLADRGEYQLTRRPTNCPLIEPRRTPRAWTQDELRRLMVACAESPGMICGWTAAQWWTAFHCLAWDTGARTSEILQFRWEWIDRQTGWISVPASARKGQRRDAFYRFQPDTLGVVLPFARDFGPLLNWDHHRTRFWQLYGELLTRAGLPNTRYDKPQKIRRSHGSWLAAAGGDATASLGHSDPRVTRAAYLDPRIVSPAPSGQLPFRVLDAG